MLGVPHNMGWSTGSRRAKLRLHFKSRWTDLLYFYGILSGFHSVTIQKYTLFVYFFIHDNKWAIFFNAWKVIMICAGQHNLPHHRTHPTHDTRRHIDLSLSVTWIERSVCTAPRGSADRRGLKKYEHILWLSFSREMLDKMLEWSWAIFLLLIKFTISTSETSLNLLLPTPVALKYVLKTVSHRERSIERNDICGNTFFRTLRLFVFIHTKTYAECVTFYWMLSAI